MIDETDDDEPFDDFDSEVELPITDTIDLHPFRPAEVGSVVEEYLREARARGFVQVRIIHGKGIGQLRRTVHAILDRTPFVLSYTLADESGGSWGSTIAHLDVTREA
jgi:dsDNA-specific endonuclease/ATPase MutS2